MNSMPIARKLFLLLFVWCIFMSQTAHAWVWNTVGGPLGTNWGPQGTTVSYSFDFAGGYATDNGPSTAVPGGWAPIITGAFNEWSAHCGLTFVQVADSGHDFNDFGAAGDIRITLHLFDGALGTLAHGYYPPPNGTTAAGDVHFDKDENWYVGLGVPGVGEIDLFSVALHEIGHAIGLDHSADPTAVMDPVYTGTPERTLTPDDITGIQSHYGESGATPEPGSMLLFALCLGALYFMNSRPVPPAPPRPPSNDRN